MRKFLIICNILCLFSMFITELFGKDEPKVTKWEMRNMIIYLDKEWNEKLKKRSAFTQEESKKIYEGMMILDTPLGNKVEIAESIKNKVITNIRQIISQEYFPKEASNWLTFYQNPKNIKAKDFYVAYKINSSRFIIRGQWVDSEISYLDFYADNPSNFIEMSNVLKVTPVHPLQKKELKIGEEGKDEIVKAIRVNLIKTSKYIRDFEF